jgi:cellobiose-specific phosphotransferase system component IIB
MRKMMMCCMTGAVALSASVMVRADEREAKQSKAPVSFRMATSAPTQDFEKMTTEDGQTVYVSPRVSFTNDEVVSALQSTGRAGLDLTITSEAAERVGRTPSERLAMFVDGRLAAAPKVAETDAAGRLVVTELTSYQVQRLAPVLGVTSDSGSGAIMRVVPRQASAAPGGIVTVDVFLSGAPSLRTYQFAIDAVGGRTGSLTREIGRIEEEREDFVLGAAQAIKAVDDSRGRAGGTMFEDEADASDPSYLGTFDYRVSDDASGTFVIKIRVGEDSFLHNGENFPIAFTPVNATIKIGAGGPRTNR